jgi:hypothetical protein
MKIQKQQRESMWGGYSTEFGTGCFRGLEKAERRNEERRIRTNSGKERKVVYVYRCFALMCFGNSNICRCITVGIEFISST